MHMQIDYLNLFICFRFFIAQSIQAHPLNPIITRKIITLYTALGFGLRIRVFSISVRFVAIRFLPLYVDIYAYCCYSAIYSAIFT